MTAPTPVPLRSPHLAGAQVAVVGLGLMGGSLAAALKGRRACAAVTGVARRTATVAQALERGCVDSATTDLARGVAAADVVVLAMPVRTIVAALPALGELLAPGTLLMDLGSTKVQIAAAMEALPRHIQVCPAHPMCGKETAGLQEAEPGLYAGSTFVLSPLPRTTPDALALAEELARAVGARPLQLDPQRHDRLAAISSHLPYLLALSLVAAAEDAASEDPLLWELAASGFRDTSRLAASDVAMMLDILMTNPGAIGQAIGRLRQQLDSLEQLLERGDEAALGPILEAAAARRRSLFRAGRLPCSSA